MSIRNFLKAIHTTTIALITSAPMVGIGESTAHVVLFSGSASWHFLRVKK